VFDVTCDPRKLFIVSNQVIVTFILPKRGVAVEDAIRLMGGETLEGPQPLPCGHRGSNEEMDVVGHYYEGVEMVSVEPGLAIIEGLNHQASYFWLAQVERANSGVIKKPVHGQESFARG
jgi:hypothetical protein